MTVSVKFLRSNGMTPDRGGAYQGVFRNFAAVDRQRGRVQKQAPAEANGKRESWEKEREKQPGGEEGDGEDGLKWARRRGDGRPGPGWTQYYRDLKGVLESRR